MSDIQYTDGLQLWVWDTGELEGFAVNLNGEILTQQVVETGRYKISKPADTWNITVSFGGADGGATKIVDTTANKTIAFQDAGTLHSYTIKA